MHAVKIRLTSGHQFRLEVRQRLRRRRSSSIAGPESHSTTPRRVRCGLGDTAHWQASLSSPEFGVPAGVCVRVGVPPPGVCVRVGDVDAAGVDVGVAPTGVNVAHFPVPRHAAWRTGLQPAGHPPSLGAAQVFPSHWQQSLAPTVAVGVAVGPVGLQLASPLHRAGVNVAQVARAQARCLSHGAAPGRTRTIAGHRTRVPFALTAVIRSRLSASA